MDELTRDEIVDAALREAEKSGQRVSVRMVNGQRSVFLHVSPIDNTVPMDVFIAMFEAAAQKCKH
jgi:hypothetical protein